METTDSIREDRFKNPTRPVLQATGMYHSFVLPDGRVLPGAMTVEEAYDRLSSYGLPDDLSGKRVLDIGPWDGFYTFECERRGAAVTAIDYYDFDTFRELARAFHSKADYRKLDVYELHPAMIGTFDIVLLLGVLYHLKHPLLALEKVCSVTNDLCIIDTYVVDGKQRQQGIETPMPYVEFYERDELAGQIDNWCGPTVSAVESMARAAGFASVELLKVTDTTARFAARRRWINLPPDTEPAVELRGITCHQNRGRTFQSAKEEYILLWPDLAAAPPVSDVFVEVDGLGAPSIYMDFNENGLQIAIRVPPALAAGRHEARVKIGMHRWSEAVPFFVDLPPIAGPLTIAATQDGLAWHKDEVDWAHGGWLTLWVAGLTAEADAANTTVEVDGIPHVPELVHPAGGQINVRLRPVIESGARTIRVLHRGAASSPHVITVKGERPPIKGLEALR